jgi:hypothetical protein
MGVGVDMESANPHAASSCIHRLDSSVTTSSGRKVKVMTGKIVI